MNKLTTKGLALVLLLGLGSCARNPVTGRKDFVLLSEQQEIAMGQQSDPSIVAEMGLYEDKTLQSFINEKGQQMAKVSHRPELKYEFKIVDSPIVNAFAVPGGYVYFTRGIMAHFNNEAEFAGVLGHEIGHITARHSAKQYSKAMLAQVGLIAGMVVSPQFAQFAEQAQQGLALLFLKFGRDDESQSDRLGVEYSTKIGYDAEEMAGFFNTLDRMSKKGEGESIPTFLSTHPDPADRNKNVQQLAAEWKAKVGDQKLAVNRESYLKMIDGIVYGEDPKQGFVEKDAFYHPVLKFQFPIPNGWQLQNSPQQVQMAPKNGKALMSLTLAPGKSLEEAGRALVEQYKLTVVESKSENANGLPALAIVADQTGDPQQQQQQQQQQPAVRALIYLVQYGGNIYNIMGLSAVNDFRNYFQTFYGVTSGFRQLTDPAKLNRQPDRIRVKTVRQTGPLSQVLREHQVPADRLEEVAVLNGLRLKDRVEAGTMIKVLGK
ncbi:MAG: M48 family metalloprotease [Cytophagales bacterium]|nr:M48 family metalloprotease [Cytophagales bacterium]